MADLPPGIPELHTAIAMLAVRIRRDCGPEAAGLIAELTALELAAAEAAARVRGAMFEGMEP